MNIIDVIILQKKSNEKYIERESDLESISCSI
jgi:hypothetical protein